MPRTSYLGGGVTRTYFDEVSRTGRKTVKCSGGCDRRLKRQKKFTHTINPFNKNKAGVPKTRAEVQKDVDAKAAAWEKEPELCIHCEAKEAAEVTG
jgi:hypothetical protein